MHLRDGTQALCGKDVRAYCLVRQRALVTCPNCQRLGARIDEARLAGVTEPILEMRCYGVTVLKMTVDERGEIHTEMGDTADLNKALKMLSDLQVAKRAEQKPTSTDGGS